MEFTEHILERYAERIQDKEGKTEIKSFVAQNRDRIQQNIEKLFESSTYLCGAKIKEHNFTHFYVNKDGWVIIVDKDKKKLITLYKVDLELGSDFNKMYIEKMTANILEKVSALEQKEQENIEQRTMSNSQIENNTAQIKELKEQIKWLEEQNNLLTQERVTQESALTVQRRELYNQIEKFIGAKVFE